MGRYRHNGGRLRVSGQRANSADCCCETRTSCPACAEDLLDEVAVDLTGFFTSGAGDCTNCTDLNAVYVLPRQSVSPPPSGTPIDGAVLCQWWDVFDDVMTCAGAHGGVSLDMQIVVSISKFTSMGTDYWQAAGEIRLADTPSLFDVRAFSEAAFTKAERDCAGSHTVTDISGTFGTYCTLAGGGTGSNSFSFTL